MKRKSKHGIGYYVGLVLMIIGAFFMLLPFYWMIISSFKSQNELLQMPPTLYPHKFVTTNFKRVLDSIPFIHYYINSLGTGILNTAVGVFTSAIIGFVFAKYNFKGRNIIFLIILAFIMIPYDVLMIPLYKLMANMGLTNSYFVLTVPYFINIFGIFLLMVVSSRLTGRRG